MPTFTIANPRRPGWPFWLARLAGAGVLALVTSAAIGALALYTALATDLPALDSFDSMAARGVTRFEAADGSLVGERYHERRLALRWEDFPRPLVLAFLAAEDERFFEHAGLDFRGILRAMVTNLFSGGTKEGASTITQQLAKTLVGNERSWARKVKEAILARRMEDLYTKEQILAWYMNLIYLGHNSYGVQAAAQNYFRKNVWELSLAEMAMLAGVPQSPSRANPASDMAATRRRMNHILDNMVSLGWATQAEADRARAEDVAVYPLRDRWNEGTPDYAEAVRRLAEPDCSAAERAAAAERQEACEPPPWPWGKDWLERGLTIRMAVEPAAQRAAAAALSTALEDLQKKQGFPGPLGRMERDAFLTRNARWVSTEAGERVLARVASVTSDRATLEVGLGIQGTLALENARWAAPYTDDPVDAKGRSTPSGRVSFGGVLKDLSKALAPGDVVLVEVLAPPPAKPASTKKPKKDALPAPSGPPALEFALVPVPLVEGALASTDLTADGLEAMVGGWDFDRSEVNRLDARRPTASSIKPIVYAKAYDLGFPPSELVDMSTSGKELMPIWRGLMKSDNDASASVLHLVLGAKNPSGNTATRKSRLEDYRAFGRTLGLPFDLGGYESDVRGAEETPRAMLRAFATFARQGRLPTLAMVREVATRDGVILERHWSPIDPHAGANDTWIAAWNEALHAAPPVISPTTAYLITRNLAAVVAEGTATQAKQVGREAAGKTGTNDYDVWFVGFTGARAAVAWLGSDRHERPLGPSRSDNRVYGATAALPAWLGYMRRVDASQRSDKKPGVAPEVPPDVVEVRIDPASGLLMPPDTEGGLLMPHRKGTEPTDVAPPTVTDF